MNKNRIILILFFVVGITGVASQLQASDLKQITATPSDVTAGNTASYTIIFQTATSIPNDGKITIQFPAGFDVSGAAFTSWTGFDGGQILTVGGQTITITRNGAGSAAGAGIKTIVLGNIVNSLVTANDYQVIITTKNAADATLDGPTGTIYFQIFSSHSESDIDGIYYLRDNNQTHYQNNGDTFGAGADIGTFSRTAPTSDENRHCNSWILFYFDENGTYTQTNQIDNIYYHVWWISNNNQGTLGYDTTGAYSIVTNESFTVNTANSPNKVGGYYLYAGKQTFSFPQFILGNAIYNFGIKFSTASSEPIIISGPNQSSFIIFNLPSDVVLQSLDSDGDGLTDYAELFPIPPIPPTNPYITDTDNDNWNDKYEVDNNLNPVDSDSAPTFGKWLLQQYNGETAGDSLGSSVSSISDIDGDSKDDILVGAPYADPGGLSNAGSAYIYSSAAGGLIKQYNGGTVNNSLGSSVSSISDIDGDSKDDVLVGATGANVAYIYSSAAGGLIKQYNGAAGDSFGRSVSSISDIDGDSKDDVLVGAPYTDPGGLSDAGSVYIYSSTAGLIKQYNGAAAGDNFGWSVSSISDIDGDSKDDVLVGARYADPGGLSNAGSVYVYSSAAGGLIKQYNGAVAGDNFGSSVSSISDIDGDSKDDVLVGAPYADPGGLSNAGSAYIYSSDTGGGLIKQYNGTAAVDWFGYSVSSISDIDGDNKDDVLVGAIWANPGTGSTCIYSSDTGGLIKQYNGAAAGDYFGYSVSSISDIDGDSKDDVLVGASAANFGDLSLSGSAYIYSSSAEIPIQSWSTGSSKNNAFDLDDYFIDPNNSTIPARNQTITYTASTVDNPYIAVSIDAENRVSFSQPSKWVGTETVVFTATDSTDLSSQSNIVTLEVTGGISGQVTIIGGDSNVADALLTLSGSTSETTNPDADGNYGLTELAIGNYTITPLLEDYYFFPTNYSYSPFDSDQTDQDFTGLHKDYDSDDNGIPDWLELMWLDSVADRDDDENTTCCITTAAYGSTIAQEVEILREFRDNYLLTNPIGETFVSAYYEFSPFLAKVITRNPILKNTAKSLFAPLVFAITDNR